MHCAALCSHESEGTQEKHAWAPYHTAPGQPALAPRRAGCINAFHRSLPGEHEPGVRGADARPDAVAMRIIDCGHVNSPPCTLCCLTLPSLHDWKFHLSLGRSLPVMMSYDWREPVGPRSAGELVGCCWRPTGRSKAAALRWRSWVSVLLPPCEVPSAGPFEMML